MRLNKYRDIHRQVMRDYRKDEYFINSESTRFVEAPQEIYGTPGVLLAGEVGCRGNVVLAVKKFLEILTDPSDANPIVETRQYAYHVLVRGVGRDKGTVFRYDNDHPLFLHPGHPDPHHKHLFDWRTGSELRPQSPVWIGEHGWPHFNTVIDETRDWYYSNRYDLPEPDAFPCLGEVR